MKLSAIHRSKFGQICGVVLPPWEALPGADQLNLENTLLDKVMVIRPDLRNSLINLLDSMADLVTAADLNALQTQSPDKLRLLVTVIGGAYYLHPEVKSALGYSGQQALTLSRGGFGAEELVLKMMEQPKRYRDPDQKK